jgi:RimJ/RimL family protein N-acetyltransferase
MPEIRPIRESDIASFRELLDAVCRERLFLATMEAPPLERVRDFVSNNIQRGFPQVVAVEQDQLIGWCDAIPGEAESGSAHIGRLGMGVTKEHRGRGLGRALAVATIDFAKEIGLEKIELAVYASNESAIALYRSLGFTEEGCRKRGRLVDGVYDDVLLMALML